MSQKVLVVNERLKIRPVISKEHLQDIVDRHFGLVLNPEIAPVEAASFDDRNFIVHGHLKVRDNDCDSVYQQYDKFVVKFYNASETPQCDWYNIINSNLLMIDAQCKPNFKVPYPIFTKRSKEERSRGTRKDENQRHRTVSLLEIPLQTDAVFENCNCDELVTDGFLRLVDGKLHATHIVRVTAFLPGQTLADGGDGIMNEELAFSWGQTVARLTIAMQNLHTPEVDARERWIVNVLTSSDMLYDPYIKSMNDKVQRSVLTQVLDQFRAETLPKLKSLTHTQWVHGDMADHNILRAEEDGGNRIIGVIDFDDAIISYRFLDLAFALIDTLSTSDHEVGVNNARKLYQGFAMLLKLTEQETSVLYHVMLILFVRNIVLVNYQDKQIDPGNNYVTMLLDNVWDSFQFVLKKGEQSLMKSIGVYLLMKLLHDHCHRGKGGFFLEEVFH